VVEERVGNQRVAEILREIALYRELGGENPFKFRAYEQAARTVEQLEEEVSVLVAEDRLRGIRGIGRSTGEVIEEIVSNGRSTLLDRLRSSFPESLMQLLSIPGMGPKKVRAVWQNLGVTSLGELEYACQENRLVSLEGFGAKSQEKILQGIGFLKRFSGRHLISEALDVAHEIVDLLTATSRFETIEIAGSLRRGKSILKDVDILLVAGPGTSPQEIRKDLVALADTDGPSDDPSEGPSYRHSHDHSYGVISAGDTKVSIRRNGLQVDFRIVTSESFPAALQHFTGSKEHNTVLRSRAKRGGLKMNEYGVFQGDQPLDLETEEDVYRCLDLAWIPPEIREAVGEIEAAASNSLPSLVEREDLKGMIHVHSTYSDGRNTIKELAEAAIASGYSFLCLSDHSRTAAYAGGLSIEALERQTIEARLLNAEMKPFRIFCGIESDILPDGGLDYPDEVLAGLDFVIGSIHSKMGMDNQEATERLIRAVRNPYLSILGHPSGRLLLSREGYSFDEDALYQAMAEEGVVLEHNCNPHRLDPGWESMRRAKERGILISIDPDAHSVEGFGDMSYGLTMARKAWLGPQDLLNCTPVEAVYERLKRTR
jgi:DNA polymerase (family 10)